MQGYHINDFAKKLFHCHVEPVNEHIKGMYRSAS